MELYEAMRTTPATRSFLDEAVPRQTLHRILDHARFAPSGGNRQGWRVVVVDDPERRRRLRDLYVLGWREYMAHVAVGLVPFAPAGGTWDAGTYYSVGSTVTYGGASYRCRQAHTALTGWEPPNVPALWSRI